MTKKDLKTFAKLCGQWYVCQTLLVVVSHLMKSRTLWRPMSTLAALFHTFPHFSTHFHTIPHSASIIQCPHQPLHCVCCIIQTGAVEAQTWTITLTHFAKSPFFLSTTMIQKGQGWVQKHTIALIEISPPPPKYVSWTHSSWDRSPQIGNFDISFVKAVLRRAI